MSLNRNSIYENLHFIGLLVLVTGLPLSMFLMSIGQIILLGTWIISGNILNRLKHFFSNPVTILLAAVFFMHLAGFTWSKDIDYAIKDTRIKIPLLLLPLVIFTTDPLPFEKIIWLIYVFIAAVVAASFVSMAVLFGYINRPVNDIRDISIFISHIRFGLLICIAVFCLIWILITRRSALKRLQIIFTGIILLWLLVFLIILQAVTAMVVLFAAALLTGIMLTFRHPNKIFKLFFMLPVSLFVFLFFHIRKIEKEVSITAKHDFSDTAHTTPRGNSYILYSPFDDTENGNPVWIYTCLAEIDSVWPTMSNMKIRENDKRGQILYFTLLRYMASKGLRKDADGLKSLSKEDITAIENGHTNYRFTNTSNINSRIYQIVWEYNHYKKHEDPKGHSVMQRIVLWKTGLVIFSENLLTGVGTGDVQSAFDDQYAKQPELSKEWRLRAHNQYLTMGITFGIFGLLLFMFSLVYPFIRMKKYTDVIYCLFLLTALLSFFTEDTLETQAGATFFAFFNSFFLFYHVGNKPITAN